MMRRATIFGLACAFACGAIALLAVPTTAGDQAQADAQQERAWRTLRRLVGQWHTSEGGQDVRTDYRLIANGNFLAAETVSVSRSEQDVHRDLEIFSYDAPNKRVMMRQFVSEGVICRYKLNEISPDGKTLTFVTEHCEGGPPKFGARATYSFPNGDEFTRSSSWRRRARNTCRPAWMHGSNA